MTEKVAETGTVGPLATLRNRSPCMFGIRLDSANNYVLCGTKRVQSCPQRLSRSLCISGPLCPHPEPLRTLTPACPCDPKHPRNTGAPHPMHHAGTPPHSLCVSKHPAH